MNVIQDFENGWHRQDCKESIFIWSDAWEKLKENQIEKEENEIKKADT